MTSFHLKGLSPNTVSHMVVRAQYMNWGEYNSVYNGGCLINIFWERRRAGFCTLNCLQMAEHDTNARIIISRRGINHLPL